MNRRVIEHLASAGITPAVEKEIVYLEKTEDSIGLNAREGDDIKSLLESNELFSRLPEREISNLTGYFRVKELKAGQNLYRQGNEGTAMYVLKEGLLRSIVEYGDGSESEIREQIQPTEHFGEECVLGPNTRGATVVAVTDCLVLEISAKEVKEVARRNGTFLSMLNQETILTKFKSLEGKHKANNPIDLSLKKVDKQSPLTSSIQTFFTDLFPSPTSKK